MAEKIAEAVPFSELSPPPSQVECITLYLFVSIKYLKLIFAWKLPAKPKRLSSKMQFLTSFTKTFGRVTRTSSSDSTAEEFAVVIPGFFCFFSSALLFHTFPFSCSSFPFYFLSSPAPGPAPGLICFPFPFSLFSSFSCSFSFSCFLSFFPFYFLSISFLARRRV